MLEVVVGQSLWLRGLTAAQAQALEEDTTFCFTAQEKRNGELKYISVPYRVAVTHGMETVVPYGGLDFIRARFPDAQYTYRTIWGPQVAALADCRLSGDDRDSQQDMLDDLYAHFGRKLYGAALIAPCGAGKTRLGIRIIHHLARPTLVCVHTKELQDQWVGRLREAFPQARIGTIGAGKMSEGDDVTVALIQTLRKVGEKIAHRYSVYLQDELHHLPAQTFAETIVQFPATVKLGLTASERRRDGMHPLMRWLVGPIVARVSQREMVDEGTVVPLTVRWVETGWTWDGDATNQYVAMLGDMCQSHGRNETIADQTAACIREGRRVLVLSARISHLEVLREAIMARCPGTTQVLTGKEKPRDRQIAMQRLVEGFPCTLATNQLAKEGLDAPLLDTLVLATPCRDRITVQQAAGRIQRAAEGKRAPLVIDFSDDVGVLTSQERDRRAVYRTLMQTPDALPGGQAVVL